MVVDSDLIVLQLDEVERQNVLDDGLYDPPKAEETPFLAKCISTNYTSDVEVSKEALYISLTNVVGLVPSEVYIQDPEAEVGNLADWGAGSAKPKTFVDASTQTGPILEPQLMPNTSSTISVSDALMKDQVVQKSLSPLNFDYRKFPTQFSRNLRSSAMATGTSPPQQSLVVAHDHKYSAKTGDRPVLDSCVLCLTKGHKSSTCPERRRTDILKCWRCGLQGVTMRSCPNCGPSWRKRFLYKKNAHFLD